MPIKIPNHLPAADVLQRENIFTMTETRADSQDIRPLKILILNLMPKKVETETQLVRLLGNTPRQVEMELIQLYTKNEAVSRWEKSGVGMRDRGRGKKVSGLTVQPVRPETISLFRFRFRYRYYSSSFFLWCRTAPTVATITMPAAVKPITDAEPVCGSSAPDGLFTVIR